MRNNALIFVKEGKKERPNSNQSNESNDHLYKSCADRQHANSRKVGMMAPTYSNLRWSSSLTSEIKDVQSSVKAMGNVALDHISVLLAKFLH